MHRKLLIARGSIEGESRLGRLLTLHQNRDGTRWWRRVFERPKHGGFGIPRDSSSVRTPQSDYSLSMLSSLWWRRVFDAPQALYRGGGFVEGEPRLERLKVPPRSADRTRKIINASQILSGGGEILKGNPAK
jgi:hypothetical protein